MVARAFEVPWFKNAMKPVASWYANAAGYRKLGLRLDDLIPEDNDTVQLALKRLPPKEAYDRLYRIRRAVQDVRYLSPIIEAIKREQAERVELDSLVLKR
ncbi:Cytochrome b-c1 complex subunit 7, mitochondrial [Microsporum audouinii]